ncbi:MAG: toll/interleukin-1 receptor domain-containing protein [Parcubacteria group bacterium]|nr:toll/interleukin-1 receptor domain-containing protein [Parcubacteria group bacterium]
METKKVFISYSVKDKNLAEVVKKNLEESGFVVFLAHETVGLSEIWINRIFQEIKACDIFLPIRTENFTQQVFPEQECGMAIGHGKCIIPLIIGTDPRHFGFLHFHQGYFFDTSDARKSCQGLCEKLHRL